jgi:hypothetical protein
MNENGDKTNTVLVFEGTYQDFDRLFTLFSSGELAQILGVPVAEVKAIAQRRPVLSARPVIDLSAWFRRSRLEDWEYEATLLGTVFSRQLSSAFGTRTTSEGDEQSDVVRKLLTQLHDDDPNVSFQAALALGECDTANPEIVQALIDRLASCDEETGWQIALSLGNLAPDHPRAAIAQRKEIELGELSLELLIALRRVAPDRVGILLQLYSIEDLHLPAQLTMLVRQEGTADLEAEAQEQTSCLRLSFVGAANSAFLLQIVWNNCTLEEQFTI